MNKNKFLILVAGILIVSMTAANTQTTKIGYKTMTQTTVTKTDEANSFAEYQAVVAALQPYIQSAKTGDGKHIRTAFFDHAHIVGSIGGEFSNPDADAFAKSVSSLGESPEVKHHIAWIDISGPAAAAKVEFSNWAGLRFTDFFVLYKHEGHWKISGKVYDSHSNN